MPVVRNEQDVKPRSLYLQYEAGDMGNSLIIKSHLYQIDSHFLKSEMRSVICKADECLYCGAGYPLNSEYNYMADLNGQIGCINIKGSVFFAIQKIAKAQNKDPRQISWTIIKKGEGLKTEYTTSKNDNLTDEDYKTIQNQLDSNTDKLTELMENHEEELGKNYTAFMNKIKDQGKPKAAAQPEVEPEPQAAPSTNPKEDVKPDEIPF